MTAAACELLSSAKDALHEDDVSRLHIPSLEEFDGRLLQDMENESDLLPEPALRSEHTASDTGKPTDDQTEDASLEDIEAKVDFFSTEH